MLTVDTRGGRAALYAVKRHWAEVAAERASWPLQGDVFAYNVMSISEPDLARIRELLHATFRGDPYHRCDLGADRLPRSAQLEPGGLEWRGAHARTQRFVTPDRPCDGATVAATTPRSAPKSNE